MGRDPCRDRSWACHICHAQPSGYGPWLDCDRSGCRQSHGCRADCVADLALPSQIIALGAGGYVAGRLAGVLHKAGSVLHGAAVWGVATLAAAWLTVSAGAGLFNLAGSALSGAGSAISATASGRLGCSGDHAGRREPTGPGRRSGRSGGFAEPVATRLRENGIAPENFQEGQEAFRNVISRSNRPAPVNWSRGRPWTSSSLRRIPAKNCPAWRIASSAVKTPC